MYQLLLNVKEKQQGDVEGEPKEGRQKTTNSRTSTRVGTANCKLNSSQKETYTKIKKTERIYQNE